MTQMWAWIASGVLAIGAVWKYVSMYKGKIRKALRVTAETLDLLNVILDAVEDKQISKEEVEKIIKSVEELQTVLK